MDKVKILVACHKPAEVYHDEVLTPIHVGRAVSQCKDEMAGMLGDDTGDNISEKNPFYSELTAQYWAWKNMHDVEYIGFCHYRSYLDLEINDGNIDALMQGRDVILRKQVYNYSMFWKFIYYIPAEDFAILLMVLKKKYPEYEQTMLDFLYGNVLYPQNMFLCRKKDFDQYAEWLFDVLSECEKHIKTSPYNRGKRSLAYMGELLMPVYMRHHHKKVMIVKGKKGPSAIQSQEKPKWINLCIWRTKKFLLQQVVFKLGRILQQKPKSLERYCIEAVMTGFKNDGIQV